MVANAQLIRLLRTHFILSYAMTNEYSYKLKKEEQV